MKNRKKMSIIISVCVILLIMAISVYAFVSYPMNSDGGSGASTNDNTGSSLEDVLNNNNEDLLTTKDSSKILVFSIYGLDDKTLEGRSDIISVVKYDPSLKKMVIVSIPSDLRVDVPGYGLTKINQAYENGGNQLIDQVVEELLGVKLNFSIKFNFDTLSKIIDDVGGVSVNAKKTYLNNEDSIVINQGSQVLNGKDGVLYIRFPSDPAVGDERMDRQQEVEISLMEHLNSTSLKEKVKLVTSYYNQGVETDIDLSKIMDYVNMSSGSTDITYENYRLQTYSEVIDGLLLYELYKQEDLEQIKKIISE